MLRESGPRTEASVMQRCQPLYTCLLIVDDWLLKITVCLSHGSGDALKHEGFYCKWLDLRGVGQQCCLEQKCILLRDALRGLIHPLTRSSVCSSSRHAGGFRKSGVTGLVHYPNLTSIRPPRRRPPGKAKTCSGLI
jgi:hypothetical protein